ncbi:MAG: AMP-binding protein [Acidobacteria bacterium]|nr:AMP-binding protein [Acidobacteriota bacterium]
MSNKQNTAISYAHGAGDTPLLGMTIGDVLDRTAALYPDSLALAVPRQGLRYNYRDFLRQVEAAARGFAALGVAKGDRVAIWATNHPEWVITQFATAKIGAILVNINPAYRAYELEYALRQSESQTLVMIRGFRDIDYVSALFSICPEAARAEPGRLRSAKLPHLENLVFIGGDSPDGMLSWKDLMKLGTDGSPPELQQRQAGLELDDPINIQYTSGTTGYPKGALLSHHNIVNNALLVGEAMRLTHQDRVCIPVPFYHCFGMVLGNMVCALYGAAMVIPAESFEPLATLQAVQGERCTALYGVPTMFIAELEHPDFASFDLTSLRTGIMAGAPCPIELMKKVVGILHCPAITIAYGLTEASPVITQTRTDDPIDLLVGTVGRALPHTEVKIIDPASGRIVLVGTAGELCTRGYLVMKGYYNNPEATREAVDADRWLHTGDIAVMDGDGYFRITGRVKDMIIRGGENIYPREIEEFLYTHPKIMDAQVIGIPDSKYGEEVMVWVRLKEGQSATAGEIRDFCRGKIAHYKIPKHVKFVSAFPMTVTGKIQKFKMRQLSIAELGPGGAETASSALAPNQAPDST